MSNETSNQQAQMSVDCLVNSQYSYCRLLERPISSLYIWMGKTCAEATVSL